MCFSASDASYFDGFPSSKLFGLPTNSLPNPCPDLPVTYRKPAAAESLPENSAVNVQQVSQATGRPVTAFKVTWSAPATDPKCKSLHSLSKPPVLGVSGTAPTLSGRQYALTMLARCAAPLETRGKLGLCQCVPDFRRVHCYHRISQKPVSLLRHVHQPSNHANVHCSSLATDLFTVQPGHQQPLIPQSAGGR